VQHIHLIPCLFYTCTDHDYCPTDVIPSEIEDDFHDFDEICMSCEIDRIHVVGAPDCPEPNCEDESGNEAYVFLVENGCSSNCATTACSERFLTLHTVHDGCDHDVLSTTSEEGLHDFEDQCDLVCNVPGSAVKDQLTCLNGGGSGAAAVRGGKSLIVAMLSVSFYFLLA
jgi:hypothetical protein